MAIEVIASLPDYLDPVDVGMTPTPKKPLSILQVNTYDVAGGAEKISYELKEIFEKRGQKSWLAVGYKNSRSPGIYKIPNDQNRSLYARFWLTAAKLFTPLAFRSQYAERLRRIVYWRGQTQRLMLINAGFEDFDYPGTSRILDIPPSKPDILHCHNLHGSYFDLTYLSNFCKNLPVFITLHDAWLFTGHCAHSFKCDKWRSGCGDCPDLTIYPSMAQDQTAYSWQRKAEIYKRSRLYLATPCNWLMNRVRQSMLWPAVKEARVIPHGVNLAIYNPLERLTAKRSVHLPDDGIVLLFVANGIRQNIWKDFRTLREAIARIAEKLPGQKILFLAMGERSHDEMIGSARIRFIPYTRDARIVARYYCAADIYIHAARQDTFPNTILESLACGTPVVATAVGGIPEQIHDGETGYLTPEGDAEALATATVRLIIDPELRRMMSYKAAQFAQTHFDLEHLADEYLSWYQETLNDGY